MLTPQELQDKKFSKAVFGGYDMREIDDFLDSVTGDYERLYKENAILKGKLKTLADKVEEYRASDDDMRRTFAEAKRAAESTVADARAEGEKILAQAREQAAEIERESRNAYEHRLGEVNAAIESEQFKLERARQSTAGFIAAVAEACRVELENLKHLGGLAGTEVPEMAPASVPQPAPAQEAGQPAAEKEPTRRFGPEEESASEGSIFGDARAVTQTVAREVAIDGGVTGEEKPEKIPFGGIFGKED